MSEPNWREATRGLVLDEHDRLLMVKYVFPSGDERWGTPGGGLDPGEDHHTALRREFHEELSLVDVEIGPHVWSRSHLFPMLSGHDGQRERFFLVRVAHFDPVPSIGWEQMRAEFVHDVRWWTIDEIDASLEHFIPGRLTTHLRALLADGPPATPIDISDP
ncbi:MAG: NUDIX hydrolase [Acidimicrobiaceae bacterium]|nr:NUDIX hydrolase [Acidimicrobiaceae bacterium]